MAKICNINFWIGKVLMMPNFKLGCPEKKMSEILEKGCNSLLAIVGGGWEAQILEWSNSLKIILVPNFVDPKLT